MGWTSYTRPPGQSDLEHLRQELFDHDDCKYELLDGATVRHTFYAAVRAIETGEVWALVVLQHRNCGRSRHDGSNYARKELEECMGPAEDRCPARILALLSDPPENEYARQWRERCQVNLVAAASKPALKNGMQFRVAKPWTFADSVKEDTFTVENALRRLFRRAVDGRPVRLPAKADWPDTQVLDQ